MSERRLCSRSALPFAIIPTLAEEESLKLPLVYAQPSILLALFLSLPFSGVLQKSVCHHSHMLQHIYTFTDGIPHTTSISHTTQYTSLQIHLHLTKLLLSFCFTHSDTCAQVTTVSLLSLSGCLVRRHLDTCGGDQINLGVPTIGTQLDESRATSNHRSHHREWAPRRVAIF